MPSDREKTAGTYTGLIGHDKVHEVNLLKLYAETVLPVDIYLPADNYFTMYYTKGTKVERRRLARWQDNKHLRFFVLKEDKEIFDDYVIDNLHLRLNSEYHEYDEKALYLHLVARDLYADLFQQTDSEIIMRNSLKLIENMVDFLSARHRSFIDKIKHQRIGNYTINHSVNHAAFMIALAKEMDVKDRQKLIDIGHGGLLMDIGKSRISPRILNKELKLTQLEWQEVKQHTKWGVEIAKKSGLVSDTGLLVIGQHHENFEGTGYPASLKGSVLSHYSNMAQIVDVYDAITSRRPYSPPESAFNAGRYLLYKKHSFNAKILIKFIDMLGIERLMNSDKENYSGRTVFDE